MKRLTGRERRHFRVRKKIIGTATCPRLSVFRSSRHIYAQLIDDTAGRTLAAASTLDKTFKSKKGSGVDVAKEVGKVIGDRATKAGVQQVVFDRSGYRYHGRVAAIAEGARESGLKF